MKSLAKIYMECRKGQDILDNFIWTYTGNDFTKEDLDALQSLSAHIDTYLEATLSVMSVEDIPKTVSEK